MLVAEALWCCSSLKQPAKPLLLDSRVDLAPDRRLVGLGHVVAFLLPASDRSARQAGFSTENTTSPIAPPLTPSSIWWKQRIF